MVKSEVEGLRQCVANLLKKDTSGEEVVAYITGAKPAQTLASAAWASSGARAPSQ